MGRGKGNSSRNPTPEIETTPRESSHRPRGRVRQFLEKVKDSANKLRSRSKDSPSRSPALSNDHQNERASSTPNIEAGPSGVVAAHTLSEIRDAQQATKRMHQLSGHATTAVSIGQNAPADLDAVDSFQNTYLKPLRVFDDVIGKIADLHPYAKMALGMLSCAAKIILAQADRDEVVLQLLEKIFKVYDFITQDDMLDKISSMHAILAKISQQTHECAHFVKSYSETKNFWIRLGNNIVSETNDTI